MPSTCPALAHAIAHSLCDGPFAPFTIQHAGSTTSPITERAPTLEAEASFLEADPAFAAAGFAGLIVVVFTAPDLAGGTATGLGLVGDAVPLTTTGLAGAFFARGFAGGTPSAPVRGGPRWANAAGGVPNHNTARPRA